MKQNKSNLISLSYSERKKAVITCISQTFHNERRSKKRKRTKNWILRIQASEADVFLKILYPSKQFIFFVFYFTNPKYLKNLIVCNDSTQIFKPTKFPRYKINNISIKKQI